MPVEFGSIGGIAAAFTVTDEFSDTLTRAEVMLREVTKAAAAFAKPAAAWSKAAAAIGAAADRTVPRIGALADAVSAAADKMRASLGLTTDEVATLTVGLRRASDLAGKIAAGPKAGAKSWANMNAQISKSDTLLTTAGDKMSHAATAAKAMAAEAADVAAAARATADAAVVAAKATNRIRIPQTLLVPDGGSGTPPIRHAPAGDGKEGGGGGHRHGSGLRFLTGAGIGAGIEERLLSTPAVAAGHVGYEAFKSAIRMQYSVAVGAEMFDTAALKNPDLLKADEERLRNFAFSTSIGTIYSAQQTADAYSMLAAILATAPPFQGKNKWKNFGAIAPIILRASEVGSMQHLGTLQDNMLAMAFYSHLLGAYTPQTMTAASDQFLAIAERTHQKMPALENNMAYVLPLARGLGISVSDTALVTGALIQGGLGRKAGIATARIITGLLQTGGPITAALQNALTALGPNAIKYKGKALKPHLAALHALGLIDASGHLTVTDKSGHIIWAALIKDIDAAAKRMPKQAFANAIYSAFGMRGARAANLFPALGKIVPAFEKSVSDTATAMQQQAAFAATTQQQFEQMIARLTDIGNILATQMLPALDNILGTLNPMLNAIDNFFSKHGTLARLLMDMATIAIGYYLGGKVGAFGAAAVVGWNTKPPLKVLKTKIPIGVAAGGFSAPLFAMIDLIWPHKKARDDSTHQTSVTINAPLNVKIDGLFAGADWASLDFYIQGWVQKHANQIGDAVKDQIDKQQKHNKRQSFLDLGHAVMAT